MTQSISAAIHIQGPAIRYAEVAQDETGAEVRRLGREPFEFDVMRVLWGEAEGVDALEQGAATVGQALRDTDASTVGLVVHPLDVYSFFVPLSVQLSEQERERRVAHQASLVTNTRSLDALYTERRTVRTASHDGETVEWTHVLAVPQEVEARMRTLLGEVSASETEARLLTSEAAARLMASPAVETPEGSADEAAGYRLAIGQYAGHTEYALSRDGMWHHAHAAQDAQAPSDQVYYAVGMLNRIGVSPDAVNRLCVYGTEADAVEAEPFEDAFGCAPAALDPFAGLRRAADLPDDESAGAYVPAIGAGALLAGD